MDFLEYQYSANSFWNELVWGIRIFPKELTDGYTEKSEANTCCIAMRLTLVVFTLLRISKRVIIIKILQ